MVSPVYLSVQNSYHILQIALYRETACLDKLVLHDVRASSHLIVHIDTLLRKHSLVLTDLSFIVADAGPGAFTSLRVAIASLNGIAFSGKVPLFGVDGLEALRQDGFFAANANTEVVGVVALLNAYNQDAYFSISSTSDHVVREYGCKKIHDVLTLVAQHFPNGMVQWCGNGVTVFAREIEQAFVGRMVCDHNALPVPSVERIAELGYQAWLQRHQGSSSITPNYLKTQLFAVQK